MSSTPLVPAIERVSAMLSAPRSDPRAGFQPGDLVDHLDIARPHEHGQDRRAAAHQGLRLVGVERRRGHEVVVKTLKAIRQLVEHRALCLDQAGKFVVQAFGIVAGVGRGAFGKEHADEGTGTPPL
jgi:hypothetical protein